MINPIDILNSWKKANNPTTQEEQLANERAAICMECPSRVKDDSLINLLISKDNPLEGFKCGECECPLAKKIYSQFGCPIDKW
jgi:uncharacterized protein YlaI